MVLRFVVVCWNRMCAMFLVALLGRTQSTLNSSNKCHASSNKCLTSSNKKLVETSS